MPEIFTQADEVQIIAEELIPGRHKHLLEFAVRIVYKFSDKAKELQGRDVIGKVERVSGLKAHLAKDDRPNAHPLTFVCRFCLDWCREEVRTAIVAEGLDYDVCRECGETHPALFDRDVPEMLVARLGENIETAESVEAAGAPQAESFFCMVVYGPPWNDLSSPRRRAAVDDLLCRCRCGSSKQGLKLWLRKPLEVFPEIIERHGLYNSELERLAGAVEPHLAQLILGARG